MDLKLIFLVILAAVSAVYLVSLFFKKGIVQAVLKCCLVPLILAIYIFGAENILAPIVLALVFGWLGDIFLLDISDPRRFKLGIAGFLLGHICYIIAMFNYARPFYTTVLVVSIAVVIVLGFSIVKIARPGKEMKIPVIAYAAIIMAMAIFAVQVFAVQGGAFGALVLAGSLCFVASDSTLAYVIFRKPSKLGDFFVMLTYIAAQLLITLGFSAPGI
jgi:uncharacterized membrane protein YhhN